jgi:hypothetical protein
MSDQRAEFIAYYLRLGYDRWTAWLLADARIEGARAFRAASDDQREGENR